jgi:hypothetical protein
MSFVRTTTTADNTSNDENNNELNTNNSAVSQIDNITTAMVGGSVADAKVEEDDPSNITNNLSSVLNKLQQDPNQAEIDKLLATIQTEDSNNNVSVSSDSKQDDTTSLSISSLNINSSSAVAGFDEYDVSNTVIRENLHKLRLRLTQNKETLTELLQQYTDEDKATVVINYDKQQFIDGKGLEQTLHVNSASVSSPQATEWRYKTKHRDVTSQVTCFGDGFGKLWADKSTQTLLPLKLILTTCCAPNLMGSSLIDQVLYSKDKAVKQNKYNKTMELLFSRWLSSQDNAGVNVVILPLIGGGVFLKTLNRDNKEIAITIINKALREALSKNKFKNIKEVVFALPNENNDLSFAYFAAQAVFKNFNASGSSVLLTIANADVFQALKLASSKGNKVGLINPGSDRAIGGNYQTNNSTHDASKSLTLEELIFSLTNAADIQALDFKKDINNCPRVVYPDHLSEKNIDADVESFLNNNNSQQQEEKSSSSNDNNSVPNSNQSNNNNNTVVKKPIIVNSELASVIKANFFKKCNPIYVFDVKGNKKVSFNTFEEAQYFANALFRNFTMGSASNQAKNNQIIPKAVQREEDTRRNRVNFVVYLSGEQAQTLMDSLPKIQQPVVASNPSPNTNNNRARPNLFSNMSAATIQSTLPPPPFVSITDSNTGTHFFGPAPSYYSSSNNQNASAQNANTNTTSTQTVRKNS